MLEKTKLEYIRLANTFIKRNLLNKNIQLTEKNIRQALIAVATKHRPAYWRRLRCALVTQQREAGFFKTAHKLRMIVNPVTNPDSQPELKAQKKQKQKRCKTVRKEEHFLLKSHLKAKKDHSLLAVIEIARILGCRPIEMLSLQFREGNQVKITGAKKTENGLRGLDRTITLTAKQHEIVQTAFLALHEQRSCLQIEKEVYIKRLQGRLATVTKNLWPKRKHRITLYSYRHLMGSDLKASGMNRIEIAAIMGHQSVDSVDVYGNSKTSQRKPTITATAESITEVRKTSLKTPLYQIKTKKQSLKQRILTSISHTTQARL
ncbi:hypothetical protein LCGC14_1021920 [marine sediment metagenome]|uniref:Uncharacterized protein n=1 Tax=marine sediment metagenome TaxID=412755 RepID=A0A0F9R347_9ZZZZ|nr:site-specific integrase [Methylophaga sp.]